MKPSLVMLGILASAFSLSQTAALAQPTALVIKPLAEKKVTQLPGGPLFWRLENFPTLAQARAAEGPTSLVAESGGRVWLFTLGPRGGATAGGTAIAEVGPLAPIAATQYLLRINEASGSPGSITPVHTHPGSESFYVLNGETSSRSPHGVMRIAAGETGTGHGADLPMQVSSSGATDLRSLVMFVVDATKPFSSPAQFP
ncbi:MAG: cupin domain-containing protein [Betaproteobacteria bacterium]